MDIIIDTHILIWCQEESEQLSTQRVSLLTDPANQIFVSQISLMELAIKYKLNKLPDFIVDIATVIRQLKDDGFLVLPIREAHLNNYQKIPLYDDHRDPFGRLLVATALSESIPIMTSDHKFKYYVDIIQII